MDTPKNNSKLIKAPTSTCNHSFSLGLDRCTLERLKELQDLPGFILNNNRKPSRTLITRQAIRFYAEVIAQSMNAKKIDFLESQKQKLEILAHTGKKS